jgi:thiol:disulfide interchange protein
MKLLGSALAILALVQTAPAGGFGLTPKIGGGKESVTYRILLDQEGYRPGDKIRIAFEISVAKGLHIQANDPGLDELVKFEIHLKAPPSVSLNKPEYPKGEAYEMPGLGTTFVHHGKTIILIRGRIGDSAEPESATVSGTLTYQACTDKTCFPPKYPNVSFKIPIVAKSSGKTLQHIDVFGPDSVKGRSPTPEPTPTPAPTVPPDPVPPASAVLPWEPFSSKRLEELTANGRTVLIDFTADWCANCKVVEHWALNTPAVKRKVEEFRVAALLADFTEPDQEIERWLKRFESISIPLTVIVPGQEMTNVIVLRDIYWQEALLAGLEQAGPSVDLSAPRPGLTLDTKISLAGVQSYSLWQILILAFVGGFLLNIMPCVLPVVSLKVLSLVQQGGESPGRVKRLGLVFCAGMLSVFVVFATVSVVAGTVWGGFFQNNAFLVAMAALLTAMGLSLFGVFTLTLPSAVGDAEGAQGEGYLGSFFKGALAVLLGTPCSGPLLGVTLAYSAAAASSQGASISYLLFMTIGLGMAAPFLVLSWRPGWVRFIPKPGPWMETFKEFMGFLLLGTAVFLLYILRDLGYATTVFCLLVGLACWIYGRWVNINAPTIRNWCVRGIAAGVVAASAWLCFSAFGADVDVSSVQANSVAAESTVSGQGISLLQAGQEAMP